MYPGGELTRLAARKAFLRARIAVRREESRIAASELARPLRWVDHAIARWRGISPLVRTVGVPLGLMLVRKFTGKIGGAKWLALAPIIMRVFRNFAQARGEARGK